MENGPSAEDRWLRHLDDLYALLQDPDLHNEDFLLRAQGRIEELSDCVDNLGTELLEGATDKDDSATGNAPTVIRMTAAAVLALGPDDSPEAVMEWFELLLGSKNHPFAQSVVETWVDVDDVDDDEGGGSDE